MYKRAREADIRNGWDKPLTTGQVAAVLGVSPSKAKTWIDDNHLGHKIGANRRVHRLDLLDFMERRGIPVPQRLRFPGRALLIGPATARLAPAFAAADWPSAWAASPFAAGIEAATLRPSVVLVDRGLGCVAAREVYEAAAGPVVVALFGPHERWAGDWLDHTVTPEEAVRWASAKIGIRPNGRPL